MSQEDTSVEPKKRRTDVEMHQHRAPQFVNAQGTAAAKDSKPGIGHEMASAVPDDVETESQYPSRSIQDCCCQIQKLKSFVQFVFSPPYFAALLVLRHAYLGCTIPANDLR